MPDISSRSREIVRCLLGDPNQKLSTHDEWRYGANGSLSIAVGGAKAGQWYDHENQRGGGILDLLWIYGDMRDDDAWEWLEREVGIRRNKPGDGRKSPEPQRKIATYTYVDERGQTLFWVYRWGPNKTFSQAQPGIGQGGVKRDENGKVTMKGARYVPYHLDHLAAAAGSGQPWRVFIVEGEKDADRLRSQWGALATTNAGGASRSKNGKSKWRSEYARYFAGADVVILPDNDEAGRDHAEQVAQNLLPVAASVRIVGLSGPEKSDISDWIDAGGTQTDLEDLLDDAEPLPKPPGAAKLLVEEVIRRRMDQIDMRAVEWLWPNRIAKGKLTLIAGHPGLGKSQAALSIAATVSCGGYWPDYGRAKAGRVLILAVEDDAEDTQKPRLCASDMDPAMVETIDAIHTIDDDGQPLHRGFSIKDDVARLGALLEELGDVALIVIDPISAYLGEDIDSHKTADVRAVLQPFQQLAARYHVALLGITHLRKSTEGDAVLLVTGSLAFVAAARAVFFVLRDEERPNRRLFLPAKNNLAVDSSGYAYSIESVTLEGPIQTSRVVWEADPVERTADEELTARRKQKDGATRKGEKQFISELLAEGPLSTKEVKDACRDAGFTWSKVQAALMEIGGFSCKINDLWGWRLP